MNEQVVTPSYKELAPRSVADALRSLAVPFGCPVGFLETARVTSFSRQSTSDAIVRTFVRGATAVVSAPNPDACDLELDDSAVQELVDLTDSEDSAGTIVWVNGLRLEIDDDPAALVMADDGTFVTQIARMPASLVVNPQRSVLDMLRMEVSAQEWTQGGGDLPVRQSVGALAGGVLVALATVEHPVGRMARLRVIVAPKYRKRGFGKLVAHELARRILGQGLLPFCRLALGDIASRALAGAVGFVTFARSLSMRVVTVREDQVSHAGESRG
ncbi:MAG TPA: GNAT family N-acetyltransferase [Gemmatimonas sp.]|nr:GNAT family N-acetyltransferase [Gemmatimonas sp.]